MTVKTKNMLFFTKSSIIIHLGKKPKKGGKPPKEISEINNETFMNLFDWKMLKVWLILKSLNSLNKITIEKFKNL